MSTIQKPNIPQIGVKNDPNVRRALDSIRAFFDRAYQDGDSLVTQTGLTTTLKGGGKTTPSPWLDPTPPPQVTGVRANGAFRLIGVTWAKTGFSNLAYYEICRASSGSFSDATKIGTTNSLMYSDSPPVASTAITYWYWVRAVSLSGVAGPWSASASASTANDPSYILEVLAGQITASELHQSLASRIDKIDGPVNSVVATALEHEDALAEAALNQVLEAHNRAKSAAAEASLLAEQIKAEQAARIQAIQDLADTSESAMIAESRARVQSAQAEADARAAALADEATARIQGFFDEAAARGIAIGAEASKREALASQILGPDGTGTSQGLIYNEAYTRAQQFDVLAQSLSMVYAGVEGGFDPALQWDFNDAGDIGAWAASGCTLGWDDGWMQQLTATAAPASISISNLSFLSSRYATIKFRIRRLSGSGWGVSVDFTTSAGGGWITGKVAASQTVTVGDSTVVTVDLSTVTTYKNKTITGIRINTGESVDDRWEFDWIMTGRQAPAVSTTMFAEEIEARATADTAQVTATNLLKATLLGEDGSGASGGMIYDERQVRLEAESALAQDIETLKVTVNNPDTGVNATASALSGLTVSVMGDPSDPENVSATAQNMMALSADVGDANARINAIDTAFAGGVEALASRVTTMEAGFEANLEGVLASEAQTRYFHALLNEEKLVRATAIEAEASSREVLSAKLDGIEGAVIETKQAMATANSATAETTSALSARLDGALATIGSVQTVLATSTEALSTELRGLIAQVGSDSVSAITDERIARATADSALASDISALTVSLGNSNALISQESTARAAADSAEAQQRLLLEAKVDENEALLQDEITARVDSDASTLEESKVFATSYGNSLANISAEALLEQALSGERQSRISAAYILEERKTRSSAIESLATQQSVLSAEINNALAAVVQEKEARVSEQEATAQTIDSMLATIDGVRAQIYAEQSVRATADSAEADARQLLEAKLSDNLQAAITNEQAVRVSQHEATTDSLALAFSRIDDSVAAITTEAITRANAISAATSRIDAVSADLANANALIVAEQNARVTADNAIAEDVDALSASLSSGGTTYEAIVSANTTAESKSASFVQSVTPTATKIGDLWIDTGNGNRIKQWNGTAWVYADDARIGATASRVETVYAALNSTFRQTTAPATRNDGGALQNGDVWIDTDDSNKTYVYSDGAWRTTTDASALNVWITGTYASDKASLQNQVDGKAETWFQDTDPKTWASGDNAKHDGDLWYSSSAKSLKRFDGSSGTWTTIEDQTAISAASSAAAAQETADGKITTFVKAGAPTADSPIAEGVGDLCINTADNNRAYRWNGSAWTEVTDPRTAENYAAIQVEQKVRALAVAEPWSDKKTYTFAAVVMTVTGDLYQCILGNTNKPPPNATYWKPVAANLYAQYTVKTDVNGKVAGFGLSNDGATSLFEIVADRFAICNTSGGGTKTPFIVDSQAGVVMDVALIKDGTITNAKIQSLSADKLTVPGTASIWDAIITTGKITNAYIGDFISSGNYDGSTVDPYGSPGATGWCIAKSGGAVFNSVKVRGDIEASSLKAGTAMIDEANIKDLAVSTLKIGVNAITVPVGVTTTGNITVGNETIVLTGSINPESCPVSIVFSFAIDGSASIADSFFYVRLKRGDTTLSTHKAYMIGLKIRQQFAACFVDTEPSSGVNIYNVTVSNAGVDGIATVSMRSMTMIGLKR